MPAGPHQSPDDSGGDIYHPSNSGPLVCFAVVLALFVAIALAAICIGKACT